MVKDNTTFLFVWAATSLQLEGTGGVCCEDCETAEPATDDDEFIGVREFATDPQQVARLRSRPTELTGLDTFSWRACPATGDPDVGARAEEF
ncbi:hypothetical protein [Streptomyces cellulosae]|uniref:hypothetical protein n=1 Tax=Streptomyces cellulosae TaxID=1968 RepID=UPI00131BBB4C|nr:hypothetical protein [Streptomyces cellulosae]